MDNKTIHWQTYAFNEFTNQRIMDDTSIPVLQLDDEIMRKMYVDSSGVPNYKLTKEERMEIFRKNNENGWTPRKISAVRMEEYFEQQ